MSSPRTWLLGACGVVLLAALAVAGVWTGRHALAIERLSGGTGDTIFLDADGEPLFSLDEQRRDVPLEHISTFFKDAIIAVEDHRYYMHPGVDPIALTRATVNNLRPGHGRQGGSTLTQQLARTLFLSNTRTYGRKVREAMIAGLIEVQLSKREILQLYMNRVYLGSGINGVETMSRTWLGKSAADLTLGEAALIAGVIRAPARYSPWRHPDAALERRLVVLRRMREEGKITAAQEDEAGREPIQIRRRPSEPEVQHGYAKAYLRQRFRSIFGDERHSHQGHQSCVCHVVCLSVVRTGATPQRSLQRAHRFAETSGPSSNQAILSRGRLSDRATTLQ